jgi:hypothetical protein
LIKQRGWNHLKDVWNVIDIINPTLVLMMLFNYYVIDDEPL